MSGFQISGLQDDEPFDDIPSGGGLANLNLQDNYGQAAQYGGAPSYGGDYDSYAAPKPAAPPAPPPRSKATGYGGDFDMPPQQAQQQPAYQAPPPREQSYQAPPQQSSSSSSFGGSGGGGGGTEAAGAASKYGGGDKCPRCNKTVYFAEAREGPNNIKYHRMCFTCVVCKKVVDSMYTERQNEIYCKSCYGKEFGPKGFGFGGSMGYVDPNGASPDKVLAPSPPVAKKTTNALASKFGGGDKCPKCEKTVYFAEAREGPNNIKFHKSCFCCHTCEKTLDSTYTERKGDVYCKSCYAKNFGPQGFGFGGAGGSGGV